MTAKELSLPDLDITIKTASFTISSEEGLTISLTEVSIGDHTALDASLTITGHSVLVKGDLTTDDVSFGDIKLKRAYLQLLFESTTDGFKTDAIIGGQVSFSELDFEASVHLYNSPDPDGENQLEWTVLAALTTDGETLALSKLVPDVAGSLLDLALNQVVFVAASKDDPSIGNMITSGYSFHEGKAKRRYSPLI